MDIKYGGKLKIFAFPCNDFGAQEPYDALAIGSFVKDYGVQFHVMEKTHMNGPKTNPLIKALKQATGSEDVDITWNFETKFLVGKDGKEVERFSPAFDPVELTPFIDRLLKA